MAPRRISSICKRPAFACSSASCKSWAETPVIFMPIWSAVPDLSPPRTPQAARLARGEGWEVVVVHVALARLRLDGIEPLRETEVGQSQRAQDLRLAPCKEPRSMDPRKHA